MCIRDRPIIGFNYGAKNFTRVKKTLDIALVASEIVCIIAFFVFQFAPMSVVSLFGSEAVSYTHLDVYKRQLLDRTILKTGGVREVMASPEMKEVFGMNFSGENE